MTTPAEFIQAKADEIQAKIAQAQVDAAELVVRRDAILASVAEAQAERAELIAFVAQVTP